MSDSSTPPPPSRLLDYLRLFRLPNVFTALADVVMGFLFVGGAAWIGNVWGAAAFLSATLGSCVLYTAGMVLNDVYDVKVDAVERPQRPLPSGRIGLNWARFLGYEMLIVGAILAGLAGLMHADPERLPWRPGVIALALAICIVLYDGILKKYWFAPLAMGGCRFLNVLLGMSLGAVDLELADPRLLYFDPAELLVAGGIGVYIMGVTQFARNEAREENHQPGLILGALIMAGGLAMLAFFPTVGVGVIRGAKLGNGAWGILILLLSSVLLRRAVFVIWKPSPAKIMGAIKIFIFSLILLDASVCLAVGQVGWAIGICALLAPMFLLGRWVYST